MNHELAALACHAWIVRLQVQGPNSVTNAYNNRTAGAQLPLPFIPSYTVVLGLTTFKGANLLATNNTINAASRVLTDYAGERLGRQNTLVLTLLLAACSA